MKWGELSGCGVIVQIVHTATNHLQCGTCSWLDQCAILVRNTLHAIKISISGINKKKKTEQKTITIGTVKIKRSKCVLRLDSLRMHEDARTPNKRQTREHPSNSDIKWNNFETESSNDQTCTRIACRRSVQSLQDIVHVNSIVRNKISSTK